MGKCFSANEKLLQSCVGFPLMYFLVGELLSHQLIKLILIAYHIKPGKQRDLTTIEAQKLNLSVKSRICSTIFHSLKHLPLLVQLITPALVSTAQVDNAMAQQFVSLMAPKNVCQKYSLYLWIFFKRWEAIRGVINGTIDGPID